MDAQWFKARMRARGVSNGDIARHRGRAASNVSHIFAGNQRMSLEWAQAFADLLGEPINEILERAGALPEPRARQLSPGFGEGDAAPFTGQPGETARTNKTAQVFGGNKPGIDVWTVQGNALALNGLLPGDQILVDTHRAERASAGDVVIAQHYDAQTGSATTLLRRYEPPVLIAASLDEGERRALVPDGRNIVIRGVVIAAWRTRD